MLSSDVLTYFSSQVKQWKSYQNAVGVLTEQYNSANKCSRILIKQQFMRFTEEQMNGPNDSDVEVFQKLFAELMLQQKQLDPAITAKDPSEINR